MNVILQLSRKSLANRRVSVALTVLSIGLSVAMLLGVERLRREARDGFASTVSGTDLVVGARTSNVHLLLASVFRIGDLNNTIAWSSYQEVAQYPEVAWTIPISLGDMHKGYRVLATNSSYFKHLRTGTDRALSLREGRWFSRPNGAVLGSQVARELGYAIGQEIVVSHGSGDVSFVHHDEHPFTVVGILDPTGTPVDRTVHVSLDGLDMIHSEFDSHGNDAESNDPLAAALAKKEKENAYAAFFGAGNDAESPEGHDHHGHHDHHHHEHHAGCDHEVGSISAFFVGLKQRNSILAVQRRITTSDSEPLSAAIPALAQQELWTVVGVVERTLLAVSTLVVAVGLTGMLVAILTSLNERRREMAILRALGAHPRQVFGLILAEAAWVVTLGITLGLMLLYLGIVILRPVVLRKVGVVLELAPPTLSDWQLMLSVFLAGAAVSVLPAIRSYRMALSDGLSVRI